MIRLLVKELRALRWYYAAPLFALYILLPLLNLVSVRMADNDVQNAAIDILGDAQKVLSLFVIWWPMLLFKEYLNAPGNELLFVFQSKANRLIWRACMLWAYYLLHALPIFIVYAFILRGYDWFAFAIALQSLLLLSAAYAIAIWLRNSFIAILLCVLYTIGCFAFQGGLNIFISDGVFIGAALWVRYAVMAAAAAASLVVGYIGERRIYL